MTIHSKIKVGNNVVVGVDHIDVETTCQGYVTLKIPLRPNVLMPVELDRKQLREFLARTCPKFTETVGYNAAATPTP
jgi:hypothetical protein